VVFTPAVDTLITRTALLVAALVLAAGVGLWRRHRDGLVTQVLAGDLVDPRALGARLGGRATLLQFSSDVCSQCDAARRILLEVAAATQGVVHVEIDAARHLDLARRLGILRTPTVLVLDRTGRVVHRANGAPSPAQVLGALAVVGAGDGSR